MTASITAFTALIDIAEDEQCDEVEEYLRGKGVEVSSTAETDLLTRLQQIIEQCHVVFQDSDLLQQAPSEVESFFYSVVSLFHVIPPEQTEEFVDNLCQKIVISASPENGAMKLRLLGLMYSHFGLGDPLRYTVLCHQVQLATEVGLTSALTVDVDKLKRWTENWCLTEIQIRRLYQLLWEAFKDATDKTLSSRILTELLRTFTSSDSHEATHFVQSLVVLLVSNPTQFVFDHVLELEPVALLKSERVYQLLNIFARERLSSFVKFYQENKDYVDGLGLEYNYCVRKMRLLTLTSLAVESTEVAFSTLSSELDLPIEEVEMLILDAICLKLLEARINQVSQKLVVTSSIHRTFQLEQWRSLRENLTSWKQNIHAVKTSLGSIKT